MLECNTTITMFPSVSRQGVWGQSAICQADKIWTWSRTCYVGCCSQDHSSTKKEDISFPTKDTVLSSIPLLQICRLLRDLMKTYKFSSKHQCQDLLSCEELFCLPQALQVLWQLGDVSVSKGNVNAPIYAHPSWWQKIFLGILKCQGWNCEFYGKHSRLLIIPTGKPCCPR